VLCDLFAPAAGVRLCDATHLVPRQGGAPANVCVQLARLGCDVELLTVVGKDPMGARVEAELAREGVGLSLLVRRADRKTGITMVEVDADGERRFYPFREKSADLSLCEADVDEAAIARAAIFVRGTVSLRLPTPRAATEKAVRAAIANGVIHAIDVNLRYGMYPSRGQLQERARRALDDVDVAKATDEEARDLFGDARNDVLLDAFHGKGADLVMLTLGAKGALLSSRTARVEVATPQVDVVDATGAGDAFLGAALAELVKRGVKRRDLADLDAATLTELGTRACRAGALTVTALGATTAMPRSLEP
jgi:fructokinase